MLVNPTVFLARSRNLNRSDNRTNFQIQFLVTYSSQRPWCWEPNPPLSLYIADPSIDPHSPARGLENIKIRDAIKRHFSFFFFFLFAFDTRFKFILGRASSIKAKVFMVMKRPSREHTAWLFNFSTESSISFLLFFPFSRLFLFSRVYNIILYRRIVGVCSTLPSFPRQERGSLSSSRNSRETFLLDREKKWKGKTERDSSTVTTPRIVGPADIGAYEA